DPWWVFRQVSGVGRAWIEAVFATNIAAPFRHGGRTHKVRDLIFSAELDRLEEIEARAGLFRAVTFHPGDVELLSLRPAPRARSTRAIWRASSAGGRKSGDRIRSWRRTTPRSSLTSRSADSVSC